jgi:hypothetical protein
MSVNDLNERSDFEDHSEDEYEESPEELGRMLIKAAANGDLSTVTTCLDKKADVNFLDKKHWTALMWAAAQGHEEIVRVLLDNNAGASYKTVEEDAEGNVTGRYNPLHWAAFNGHLRVVWLLLNKGFSAEDLDIFGNTAVHQAAGGGRLKILECFLSFGFAVDSRNSRGHRPLDLTTDPDCRASIQTAMKTTECTQCGQTFDLHNHKFICQVCTRFFCSKCCSIYWTRQTIDSLNDDRPVCRCNHCQDYIASSEGRINSALESNDLGLVTSVIQEVKSGNVDVDIRLLDKIQVDFERLKTEADITRLVTSLAYVENYKTIQKSVYLLSQALDDAKKRNVELDPLLINRVKKERERLMSERNLRHLTVVSPLGNATQDDVDRLANLMQLAEENGVAEEYLRTASTLKDRMESSIKSHHLLSKFIDYPMREYPEPVVVDPRNRGRPPPPPPPPKKKRREPKFLIPEWATEIPSLVETIKSLETLLERHEELQLSDELMTQAKENIIRMKKEVKFRQQMAEEARIEAEKKAKAKAKAR